MNLLKSFKTWKQSDKIITNCNMALFAAIIPKVRITFAKAIISESQIIL